LALSEGPRSNGRRPGEGLSPWDEQDDIARSLRAANQASYHWSIANDKISWSSNAAEILGLSDSDLIGSGRGYASLLDGDNFMTRFQAVMQSPAVDEGDGVAFHLEYKFRPHGRNDPTALWLEDTGRWMAGPDGRPKDVFGVIRNIDARYERDHRLRRLDHCDALTGMMSRARTMEALTQAISAAQREGRGCAFLLAAIGNLAVTNDTYGFDVGDEVIVGVGARLKETVRSGDAIGRYSGTKFALILGDCEEGDVESAAERFLKAVRDRVIETERGPVWAMLSIGGLFLPNHATNANLAIARAEEALAEARRLPGEGFAGYTPSPEKASVRSLNAQCATDIVSALKDDRFTLAFQPIVEARSGKVKMHEALLRMRLPDGRNIAAAHLVPIAEKLGLIKLIDRRVMALAVKTLKRHGAAQLALNVSAVTATDRAWAARLIEILAPHRECLSRLTIEIAETAAFSDIDAVVHFVSELRRLGCKVAIDDFGAGYTSFRNLKVLNANIVKIDGSFADRLASTTDNQHFVRSLLELARLFNLTTVAEWVEREEDARLLTTWGVDYLQGDLFGAAAVEPPWEKERQTAEERQEALPAAPMIDEPPSDATGSSKTPGDEQHVGDFSQLRLALSTLDKQFGYKRTASEAPALKAAG
jgi:diguanylate cyclase (GGDEF)-like protein